MPNTVISLASSTDRDYEFLVPLTALLWKEHIGYRPVVYLVGTIDEWSGSTHAVVLNALRGLGVERRFIDRLSGYGHSTVAQNVREHAAVNREISDEAWVMPADADLWPLRRDYYQQHETFGGRAVLYNANGDHFQGKAETDRRVREKIPYQSIPTCHVAMRAGTWRQAYRYASGDVRQAVCATLDGWLRPKFDDPAYHDPGFEEWMSDQRILTEHLIAQPWFPEFRVDDKNRHDRFDEGDVRFITRRGHPPDDRLCRSVPSLWSANYDPARWTDGHMHKASHRADVWQVTHPVLAAHLPARAAWANQYRDEYLAAVEKETP